MTHQGHGHIHSTGEWGWQKAEDHGVSPSHPLQPDAHEEVGRSFHSTCHWAEERRALYETTAQTHGHPRHTVTPRVSPPPRRSRQPTPCFPGFNSLGWDKCFLWLVESTEALYAALRAELSRTLCAAQRSGLRNERRECRERESCAGQNWEGMVWMCNFKQVKMEGTDCVRPLSSPTSQLCLSTLISTIYL